MIVVREYIGLDLGGFEERRSFSGQWY